jgi:hypothetical protein
MGFLSLKAEYQEIKLKELQKEFPWPRDKIDQQNIRKTFSKAIIKVNDKRQR